MSAMPPSKYSSPGNGFSLVELLVVLGILGILAVILIPTVQSMRIRATDSQCLSNLRSVSSALKLYANDHDGYLPGENAPTGYMIAAEATQEKGEIKTSGYVTDLLPYVNDHTVFLSPALDSTLSYKLKLGPWTWARLRGTRLQMMDFNYPAKQIIAHQRESSNETESVSDGQTPMPYSPMGTRKDSIFTQAITKTAAKRIPIGSMPRMIRHAPAGFGTAIRGPVGTALRIPVIGLNDSTRPPMKK